MADGVFNISKGRVNEYVSRVANNDPANSAIVLVFLKVAEADATLEDYATLADLLAGSNTEADFTNYARKVLTDADISEPTTDNTNNWQFSDFPDQTYSSAGGASNNNLVKLIPCYDSDTTGGTDANIIPLTFQDFVATTTGINLLAVVDSGGFFRATQ